MQPLDEMAFSLSLIAHRWRAPVSRPRARGHQTRESLLRGRGSQQDRGLHVRAGFVTRPLRAQATTTSLMSQCCELPQ